MTFLPYRLAVVAIALSTLLSAGCGVPPTLEQCGTDANCVDKAMGVDLAKNTLAGGIIGAAIGGGIGYIAGGPRVATLGAISGGAGGAATGLLVTYYADHR